MLLLNLRLTTFAPMSKSTYAPSQAPLDLDVREVLGLFGLSSTFLRWFLEGSGEACILGCG